MAECVCASAAGMDIAKIPQDRVGCDNDSGEMLFLWQQCVLQEVQ